MQRVTIQAVKGGVQVNTQGLVSTTIVEGSFPGCTITVFNTGTIVPTNIFGDNLSPPTVKGNPFTADSNGFGFFYAANGSRVDIQLSGTGVTTPFVVAGDVLVDDGTLLQTIPPVTVAFSATPTFDLSQASWFQMTLTGNVTVPAFTNPVTGQLLILTLIQDGAGAHTFAFPAAFLRPPVIALAANAVTELTFKYDGTNWRALAASGDNTTVPTQLLASSGSAALPSIALSASQTTGFFRQAADVIGVSIAGVLKRLLNAAGELFGSAQAIAWSSNTDPSAAGGDSFLARIGAAIWGFGTTNGGTDGEIRLGKVNKITFTQPATAATLTLANNSTLTGQATGTIVNRDSTDTLTGKTYDTAGAGNVFKINGTTITAVVGSGSVVLATAPTITSPVIATGVSQGSGLKHQRFGVTCTTAAAAGATCTSNFTWTAAFADNNYTFNCMGGAAAAGVPVVDSAIKSGAAGTQITVQVVALTAAAAQFSTVECIAIHD